jgi:magnesium transporter
MINRVQTKKVLTLLKKLDVDEVAEVLALIPKEKSDFIVSKLSPRVKKMITKVLGYPEDSAGRAMNPDILSATENMTVQQVIDKIRGLAPKSNGHYYVYVVDKEGKLIGVLSLHELIVSNLQAKIIDIANRNVIKVTTRTHKDEASKIIIRYSLSALPVVDREGVLRGKITMHDIMDETAEKSFLTKPKHAALLKRYPRKQKHAPTTSKKKPSQ